MRKSYPEEALQRQIWQAFEALGVTKRAIVWHTPNGGKRYAREAARFKSLGVVPGIADFVFLAPIAACIELKAGKNTLSPKQKIFRDRCIEHGVPFKVARSLDEALEIVEEWGLLARNGQRYSMNPKRVSELASVFGGE